MVSLREYAKNKGISYEAVRKQVSRYKNELDGHIFKNGRTQFLDEEALSFLDKKRADSPIIVMETSKDEEIERLQEENKALLLKITQLQDQLLLEKEQVKTLQCEKIALLEEKKEEATKRKWKFWK